MVENVTGSLRSLSFITRWEEIAFNQHCACVSVYLYMGAGRKAFREKDRMMIMWCRRIIIHSLMCRLLTSVWVISGAVYYIPIKKSFEHVLWNLFWNLSVYSSYPTVAWLTLQKTSSFSGSVRSNPSLKKVLKFKQYSCWVLNFWCAVCQIPLATDHMSN